MSRGRTARTFLPSFIPPAFRVLRFQEDYAYLADPAKRVDPFDLIKYIPLGLNDPTCFLSLGGELRERYEYNQNPGFGTRVRHNDYLLQRITLSADLHLGPHLRFSVQGISGLQFFADVPSPPTQDDRANLQMAFADLRWGDAPDQYLLLRLGRQEMSYGVGRLIATRAAPNIPFKFDGVTARARWGTAIVSAFLVRPGLESSYHFDGEDDKTTFWGVYGESVLPGLPAVSVNAYCLGLRREQTSFASGTATEHNHTFGLRFFGKAGSWDYDDEGAFQVGSFGNRSLLAWTLSNDSGYTFADLPWQPRLGLKADVARGNTQRHGGTLETFDPLYFKSGYFNDASLYRPSNLIDVHPSIQVTPRESIVLGLARDGLWRYSVNDGVYSPPGNVVLPPNGHGSHYLGTTFEATLEWKINRHLTFDAAYVHFSAAVTSRKLTATTWTISAPPFPSFFNVRLLRPMDRPAIGVSLTPQRDASSALRRPLFRALWLASVVSNVGTWMQNVGAGWLMTSLSPSPTVVALVQAATTLPVFLLALPGGALADLFDRRRVGMGGIRHGIGRRRGG